MDKKAHIFLLGGILVLSGLACSLPITVTIGQQAQPATPVPAMPPAQPASPVPSEAPVLTPTAEGSWQQPAAILADPMDNKGVNLLAPDGSILTELIHAAGVDLDFSKTIPSSPYTLPNEANRVMYYTYQGSELNEFWGGGTAGMGQTIAVIPNLAALEGKAWCDGFSYSTVEMSGDGTNNALYLAGQAELGKTGPILSTFDARGYAIFPVSVICGEGQPAGVWYADMPYGIGGDIVFPPFSGLYRYETANSGSVAVLDEGQRFSGISDDQSLVAYSHIDDPATLFILDVKKNSQIGIPTLSGSDRGAGDAVFSPDDAKVAWMEGSGYSMSDTPNFKQVIRAGTPGGAILVEKTDSDFGAAVGLSTLWVKPVVWLDAANVLVEGRGEGWTDSYLLKLNTEKGTITLFAKGVYLGRYYPKN